ncbi:hypothetical protein Nhal_1107 [Nitrosococcus halophilus Nc 4]|uniref:Uncharacterized protein n=1 Tax=Nitrosococcus halophilus (strain Nc4) TaxID=472759 RepID=D5BZI4_NITHN|nr:hypothetical protein Nhal_1107 [Nitrosococcus halophilus Nc 4]
MLWNVVALALRVPYCCYLGLETTQIVSKCAIVKVENSENRFGDPRILI